VNFKQQTKKICENKQGQKKVQPIQTNNFIFKLIKRQNNDNTKRSKETKKYNDSSSNSEDDKGQNLTKQKNMMSQAAIVTTKKYAKLIQETAKPLPDGDGNWQNADKH
jgi:hypothetical protein